MSKRIMLVNVVLAVLVDDDEEFKASLAIDGVNECLRPIEHRFSQYSCLLDYSVGEPRDCSVGPEGYEEGDAFADQP
jgi:hypothetical protein